MNFLLFFGLVYTVSNSCMMNFSTTDLFYLRDMCRSDAPPIQDYLSNENIVVILSHLPFNDQLSLTSTCTAFRKLPVHAKHIKPKLNIGSTDKKLAAAFLTIALVGFGTTAILGFYINKLIPRSNAVLQIAIPIATIGTMTMLMAETSFCCVKTIEKADANTQTKRTSIMYNTIANRMKASLLTTDTLAIEFYAPAQVTPILEAARTSKVANLIITIPKLEAKQEQFDQFSILANNEHLKSLKIDNKTDDLVNILNFYSNLTNNDHLQELKLKDVRSNEELLSLIVRKKSLKTFSLSGPKYMHILPFWLKDLANNTTLEHLTFESIHLSSNAVPHILSFMQHNANLKTLTIKDTTLSNADIQQLVNAVDFNLRTKYWIRVPGYFELTNKNA